MKNNYYNLINNYSNNRKIQIFSNINIVNYLKIY